MNKIEFTKRELLQLEFELNGGVTHDGSITYEGFLRQYLPVNLKYELQTLSEYLVNFLNEIMEIRENLLLKHGTPNEKGVVVVNSDLFNKEFDEILNQTIEIEYPDIFLEDVKKMGRTKDDYRMLFHLIKSN
jgi:hypothetical protein